MGCWSGQITISCRKSSQDACSPCRDATLAFRNLPEPDSDTKMKTLKIKSQPIELCNVLKLQGMVASGGMAKVEIAGGLVRVNGELETRKRRKIVSGDVVEYGTESVRVVLQEQK
jgi:ribosome-associated protein